MEGPYEEAKLRRTVGKFGTYDMAGARQGQVGAVEKYTLKYFGWERLQRRPIHQGAGGQDRRQRLLNLRGLAAQGKRSFFR